MKKYLDILKLLKLHCKGFYFKIILSYLLSFLRTFLTTLQPLFIMVIINVLSKGRDIELVIFVCLLEIIVAGFLIIFSYIEDVITNYVSSHVILNIKLHFFDHVQRLPIDFFTRETPAAILNRVNNDVGSFNLFINGTFKNFFNGIVTIVSVLGISGMMGGEFILIALVSSVIYSGTTIFFSKKNKELEVEGTAARAATYNTLLESVSAIDLVKAYQTEHLEISKLKKSLLDQTELVFKGLDLRYSRRALNESLRMAVNFIIIVYCSWLVINGKMLLGGFIAVIQYVQKLSNSFNSFTLQYTGFSAAMGIIERVMNIYNIAPEHSTMPRENIKSLSEKGYLTLKDVSYGYGEKTIVKNCNLEINRKDKILLFGESGTGKTTFIKLLLRYIKPSGGMLYLEGLDAESIDLCEYRKHFGIVLQQMRLFSGSIRDNICYGMTDVTDKEIFKAMEAVNLNSDILAMEKGYDSDISAVQTQLSVGQLQRISLARAVLRDPSFLILDEATSALDYKNDEKVKKALREIIADKTCLVVSHDLTFIDITNRYITIRDGKLVEVPRVEIETILAEK